MSVSGGAEETLTYSSTFGPYQLLGELARGGMGVVFRAKHSGLDRIVALKMVLGLQPNSTAVQRFILEAKAAAVLDHPNIVPVYDIGEVDGRVYYTMAFVGGPSLKAFVEGRGMPSVSHAISIFSQIVAGMAQAHKQGIVHRDLKPANVLLDPDGRPRVADFGLAKFHGSNESGAQGMTQTGQVVGTPAYMAPEQARGSKDVGPPADVYALGAVLYFLLTGRPPFEGENVADLLIKVVSEEPKSPREHNPEVAEDIAVVCLKCLAKNATDRYVDAIALADAISPLIDRYASRSSLNITPLNIPTPTGRPLPPGLLATTTSPISSRTEVIAEESYTRKKWLAMLLPVVLVLAGIGIYFAVRGGKNNIAVTTPTTNNAKIAFERTWPDARKDFPISVDLLTDNQSLTGDVVELQKNTRLQLKIQSQVACNIMVFVVDPNGEATKLFPNKFEPDSKFEPGKARTIPSNPDWAAKATPTVGEGAERIRIFATTGPLPELPDGKKIEHFSAFVDAEARANLEQALSATRGKRGIEIVPLDAQGERKLQIAEAELLFRVK